MSYETKTNNTLKRSNTEILNRNEYINSSQQDMDQKTALQIAKELANRLKTIVPDFKMLLYGSYARGHPTSDSDIDIYIEIPHRYFSDDLKNKVTNLVWELSFLNETVIQISLYSDEQVWNTPRRSSPFINSVMKEGILI